MCAERVLGRSTMMGREALAPTTTVHHRLSYPILAALTGDQSYSGYCPSLAYILGWVDVWG